MVVMINDFQDENEPSTSISQSNTEEISEGRKKLKSYLNKNFRIEMTDGRILTGLFLCTDRDANIILGMCVETRPDNSENDRASERNLGLCIVPKKAISKIEVDIAGDINEASIL